MKLLSCYIAGFGKFVKRQIPFDGNPVVIKEDNGWGKTTLADFIKCMLYGMENSRSRALETNERKKYEPWQGGVFGGSLTFLYAGRKYRIERTFGKTASMDTARLFDENEMQSYAFGDKAEHLGEALFGVDRDSYQRSVYVPQGEIPTGNLPDDMKNRLLALLGGNGQGGGSEVAFERLETAERALRAKRKPAKGKLDAIDERLQEISREKANCEQCLAQARSLRADMQRKEEEIGFYNQRLEGLSAAIEKLSRQNEWQARQDAYRQAQTQLRGNNATLGELQAFFGDVAPASVNVDGLQTAVGEFYSLKGALADTERELSRAEDVLREKKNLETQFSACQKAKKTYDLFMAGKGERTGAGMRSPSEKRAKVGGIKGVFWFVFLLIAVLGGGLVKTQPVLGGIALTIGAVGILTMTVMLLRGRKRNAKRSNKEETATEEALKGLAETEKELAEISRRLSAFPSDAEQICQRLTAQKTQQKQRLDSVEKGIARFLQKFAFREIYDYRVALSTLKENIASYARLTHSVAELQTQVNAWADGLQGQDVAPQESALGDISALKNEKAQMERAKESSVAEHARLATKAEQLEEAADTSGLDGEADALNHEKERLERRLYAIKAAKEILLRAEENIASRYLEPVGLRCRAYLKMLQGETGATLRFSADGAPFIEENGGTHEVDYYSVGSKELIGFCTRIALAETMFTRETPVLILDDPFVNLDDEKTEKAKRLVKELSKKYQIVYFTCKNERRL